MFVSGHATRGPRLRTAQSSLAGSGFARLVALIVLVSAVVVFLPHTPAAAQTTAYVDADGLNLRDGPGTWAAVVNVMWPGEAVTVLDGPVDDGWYYVDYYGQVGWAYGGYLSFEGGVGGSSWEEPEHWIDVDRSSQTVTLYVGDEAIASYWAALGWDNSGDGFYSTALGSYTVSGMHEGLTWTEWGQAYIQYWVGFDPSRVNGFHSYSMNSRGSVLKNGDGPTGGCVALEPSAARELFNFAFEGMRVEVHK